MKSQDDPVDNISKPLTAAEVAKLSKWCDGRLTRVPETTNYLHPVWRCGKCAREFSEGFGYSPHQIVEDDRISVAGKTL